MSLADRVYSLLISNLDISEEDKQKLRELLQKRQSELDIDESELGKASAVTLWNLVREVPALYVNENGGGMYIIFDIDSMDVFVEDCVISFSDDWDYENPFRLDNLAPIYEIPEAYYEELMTYGNALSFIVKLSSGAVVAIRGRFLGNTLLLKLPVDDLGDDEFDELVKLLSDEYLKEIAEICKSYTWVLSDAYRGCYQAVKEPQCQFKKVIEGWVAIGDYSDRVINRLASLDRLELPIEDYPDCPVLLVFPRSSNVCVTYFDVYVPTDKAKYFLQWLNAVGYESFDLKHGHYVRVLV